MQITPSDITNYNRTDAELQAFWLFGAFCAGKNSDYAARCLASLLKNSNGKNPFDYLRELGETAIHNALVACRIGQYARLCSFIMQSLNLDLRTATVDDLIKVHGIGPKTARFFLLHTRQNEQLAVLDTHILKFLRDNGFDAPQSTPTNKNKYAQLEKSFLYLCSTLFPSMSVADVDLTLWMKYSGRLETDNKEPELFGQKLA